MKAPQAPINQYLIKNNTKLIEDRGKENAFRDIWEII